MLLASILTALLPHAVPTADSLPALSCDARAASVAAPAHAGDLATALAAHGGVVRWATDAGPVVVWLQDRPRDRAGARHAAAEWRTALADAVTAWTAIAPGLRLVVGRDSAAAQIRVVWAATLPTAPNDPSAGALASLTASLTAGRTTLTPDASGRAVSALVVLAATAPNGALYQPRDVHAVAQHELGHALGLAHHAAPSSVMAPLVTAERIGDDDRAVLRALYALPVGAGCANTSIVAPAKDGAQ